MTMDKKFEGKYLVIGSVKHLGEVESFNWEDETIQQLNLNDYRTVILHLDSIPNQLIGNGENTIKLLSRKEQQPELFAQIDESILVNLHWLSYHLVDHTEKEQLTVFIICSPVNRFNSNLFSQNLFLSKSDAERLNLTYDTLLPQKYADMQLVDLRYDLFSNLQFEMVKEQNISMINANSVVEPYFDEFSNFDFIFRVKGQHSPLAHTFYNAELAFMQFLDGIDLIIMPHPKLVTPFDSNEAIIRGILDIESEEHLEIPDWVDGFNTNRQRDLIHTITELEQQISSLKQQIKERQVEFDIIRRFQRILFTRGEILKQSVFEMFDSMGTKVTIPEDKLSHDIELETADTLFVVQVLTLDNNTLQRHTLRQLNQWVELKEEKVEFKKPVKGVCIINYEIKNHPDERSKLVIEPAANSYIEKMRFCLISTPYLFDLYKQVERGEIGKFEILDQLSQCQGRFHFVFD